MQNVKREFEETSQITNDQISRSSRPDIFCEKGVLRNLAKLTGKHLRQSLFFNKVAGPRPFAKFLTTPFLQNTSGRLLLSFPLDFTSAS